MWVVRMLRHEDEQPTAVHVNEIEETHWILFDTGSGLTGCAPDFASGIPMGGAADSPRWELANGESLTSHGTCAASFDTDGVHISVSFQVTHVRRAILSAESSSKKVAHLGFGQETVHRSES